MANEEVKEERQMLPEVKAYIDAIEATKAAFTKAISEAEAKYPKRLDRMTDEGHMQRRAFNDAQDAAYDARRAACDTAWGALKASGDPLVKWVAENCEDYQSEALTVLKALPATLEELDDLAERQDWCGTWVTFRERAIAAGAIPGTEPPSEAYKAVFAAIDKASCCPLDAYGKRRVSKALDTLLAEIKGETSETKTEEAVAA